MSIKQLTHLWQYQRPLPLQLLHHVGHIPLGSILYCSPFVLPAGVCAFDNYSECIFKHAYKSILVSLRVRVPVACDLVRVRLQRSVYVGQETRYTFALTRSASHFAFPQANFTGVIWFYNSYIWNTFMCLNPNWLRSL